jgi:membrane protein required for colicin V production
MKVTILDTILFVLILLLVVRGTLRGFVKEMMAMASVTLGFLTALLLYKQGGAFVRTKILAELAILPEIIAFLVLFLIVFILIKLVEAILQDIILGINLGGLDRFLGLVFGLLEGLVLVCLVLLVLSIQPLFDPAQILEQSIFAKFFLPVARGINQYFAAAALPYGSIAALRVVINIGV